MAKQSYAIENTPESRRSIGEAAFARTNANRHIYDSWIGTHDSAFVGDLSNPTINQVLSVEDQLTAGVRFLQSQTHMNIFDTFSMCHTDCMLNDAGPVKNYLSTVKKWMDSHPTDIITLLLTNGDFVDVSKFDDAFKGADLDKYAFVPDTTPDPLPMSDWPTLGELIASGKRLVVFTDYGAEVTKVPYVLNEFKYFFETPYNVTDPNFAQCKLDRPPGASPDGRMYLMNHFLNDDAGLLGDIFSPNSDIQVPNTDKISQTNAATGKGSVGAQVNLCTETYGRKPNLVLLNFFNKGDAFAAQDAMNF